MIGTVVPWRLRVAGWLLAIKPISRLFIRRTPFCQSEHEPPLGWSHGDFSEICHIEHRRYVRALIHYRAEHRAYTFPTKLTCWYPL